MHDLLLRADVLHPFTQGCMPKMDIEVAVGKGCDDLEYVIQLGCGGS